MQALKESRSSTSCTECQRRKQKCSREWPCNHCQARKVAHLCHFGIKKVQPESSSDSARFTESSGDVRGQKRSLPESNWARDVANDDNNSEQAEDGLKVWGYMPGHVHYKVGTLDEKPSPRNGQWSDSNVSDAVDKILHAIPPRSITDAFVNHFLSVVNYRYSAIYGPTLTDQYVQWWADRAAGRRLSPEFTCLLLRICAYSVQYLTPTLRKMMEFELACDTQVLTDRFAAAADQLSQSFEASSTTIERVQEQFLKGAWLKSESKIVESWHTLGCTIRAAQEMGMDKNDNPEGLSEFDLEIRRRIWTLLYIWDWQMSAWLGRPNLIDQKNLSFNFPNLRLDQSNTEANLLSPFAHMALQAQLGRRIATMVGDAQSTTEIPAKQILAIEAECETFIEELPAVFRIKNADTSFDEQHPYFVFQRLQLHVVIFVTMLDFLKPFLTRERHDKLTDRDDQFRGMGVDIALKLLQVAHKLFDHEFPINAKFHMVVFSIFDTSTVLCSAIIHDRGKVLLRREEVMDVIETSLEMLHQLSVTTKLGASSYGFLYKLVQATPELRRHLPTKKRQRQEVISPPERATVPSLHTVEAPAENAISTSASAFSYPLPAVSTSEDLSFDVDQFLANNPFGSYSTPEKFDMGGMEQIWDWADLHLDGH